MNRYEKVELAARLTGVVLVALGAEAVLRACADRLAQIVMGGSFPPGSVTWWSLGLAGPAVWMGAGAWTLYCSHGLASFFLGLPAVRGAPDRRLPLLIGSTFVGLALVLPVVAGFASVGVMMAGSVLRSGAGSIVGLPASPWLEQGPIIAAGLLPAVPGVYLLAVPRHVQVFLRRCTRLRAGRGQTARLLATGMALVALYSVARYLCESVGATIGWAWLIDRASRGEPDLVDLPVLESAILRSFASKLLALVVAGVVLVFAGRIPRAVSRGVRGGGGATRWPWPGRRTAFHVALLACAAYMLCRVAGSVFLLLLPESLRDPYDMLALSAGTAAAVPVLLLATGRAAAGAGLARRAYPLDTKPEAESLAALRATLGTALALIGLASAIVLSGNPSFHLAAGAGGVALGLGLAVFREPLARRLLPSNGPEASTTDEARNDQLGAWLPLLGVYIFLAHVDMLGAVALRGEREFVVRGNPFVPVAGLVLLFAGRRLAPLLSPAAIRRGLTMLSRRFGGPKPEGMRE